MFISLSDNLLLVVSHFTECQKVGYKHFQRYSIGSLLLKPCNMKGYINILVLICLASICHGDPVAGFIGVDEIRMLLKKIPSLIILFNFYIYIILVLKINNSIISALKIMNQNILQLNFQCSIAEYASKPCLECAWCKSGPVNVFPMSPHWRLCWRGCPNIFRQFCIVANIRKILHSLQEDGHACGGDEEFHHGLTLNLSEKNFPINLGLVKNTKDI